MNWTLGQLCNLFGGELVDTDPNDIVTSFALDSREVSKGALFCAIKGSRVDGHDFVAGALASGAVCCLVEHPVPGPHLLVKSIESALASAASKIRSSFAGPVIGITGSNGKTSAKEFTAAVLSPLGLVAKSAGNRNTEFSSPLLWLEQDIQSCKAVVVELAMRGLHQIQHLSKFTRPTVAIITMIGTSHAEMVGSREGIAQAKSEILGPYEGGEFPEVAILWQEDDFNSFLRNKVAPSTKVRTFGFGFDAECQVLGYRTLGWDRCIVRGKLDGESFEAELPTIGRHQALNAAAAVLAAHSIGVSVNDASAHLQNAQLPPMRMEVRQLNGATVLVDTYNASPDSTVAAIKTLSELACDGNRFAVIGEMRELGDFAETGHRMVGKAIAVSPIERVVLLGSLAEWVKSEALYSGYPASQISIVQDLHGVRDFLDRLSPGDLVLLKGSRALELEKALEVVA